jgi:hypothetical protein
MVDKVRLVKKRGTVAGRLALLVEMKISRVGVAYT